MSRFAVVHPVGPSAPAYPEISQKRVLVTGASSDLGAAIAASYARQGCSLILQFDSAASNDISLAESLRDMTAGLRVFDCKLSNEAATRRLTDAAVRAFGGIDILVNNVSAVPFDCGAAETVDAFDGAVAENLMIACHLAECAAEAMQRQGRDGTILYAAETRPISTDEDFARYAIAKVGLDAVTQGQAWEWADDGISVNSLLAGPNASLGEVAAAAVYQATDEASWISGKTLTFGQA